MQHLWAFKNKMADSILYKHKRLEHFKENVEYGLDIAGIFKDALTLQANESV